jgi:hypothetical protein
VIKLTPVMFAVSGTEILEGKRIERKAEDCT